MNLKNILLASCSIVCLVYISTEQLVSCNPVAFDPTVAPMLSFPPVPLQAPMLMAQASQYDPYASMQMPQYVYGPSPFHYGPMPYDSDRRSNKKFGHNNNRNAANAGNNGQEEMTDEQKALAGIPVSFIEPEGPSTIPERISDSFSALGEGVKNHFRSLTENFSDTIDDIKDAWRFEGSKKRNRRMIKA